MRGQEERAPGQGRKECPICRNQIDEVVKYGRLGCDLCPIVFREHLEEAIRQIQSDSKAHSGHQPKDYREYLQARLEDAEEMVRDFEKKASPLLHDARALVVYFQRELLALD